MSKSSETDPTGRSPKEKGAKLDHGKPPIERGLLAYFPRAAAAVAEVSAFGALKYTWNGWETVPEGMIRYGDAMLRASARRPRRVVRYGEAGADPARHGEVR